MRKRTVVNKMVLALRGIQGPQHLKQQTPQMTNRHARRAAQQAMQIIWSVFKDQVKIHVGRVHGGVRGEDKRRAGLDKVEQRDEVITTLLFLLATHEITTNIIYTPMMS